MRAIDEAAKTHQRDGVSGVTAGHDSIEVRVDIIGLAFPHQLVGGHTTKAGQWLCTKPGIGRQVGTCVARDPVENFEHLTQSCLCLSRPDAGRARERDLTPCLALPRKSRHGLNAVDNSKKMSIICDWSYIMVTFKS